MAIKVQSLAMDGLQLVTPKRLGDARGFFSETYNFADFCAAGMEACFVQDNHSLSAKVGTVRGLHFQVPPFAQDKLTRVVRGRILDVVVDLRRASLTFGKHAAIELSAENWAQLFIPAGLAHGFCTLEPNTEVVYKVSRPYAPEFDRGILWNDPALGIAWPAFAGSEISGKDRMLPPLSQYETPF